MAHGKRYRADIDGWDREKPMSLSEAVAKLKTFRKTKFDQTVQLTMHLGIEGKQNDQRVRGAIALPHGIGKSKRVIAFCKDDMVGPAKAAGAIEAGGDDLVKKIEGGWMEFDVAIASPDMMRSVSKLGKVLGPKGLMPSPKGGTVTPQVEQAVREYTAGKIEFDTKDSVLIQVVIGKHSFEEKQLVENAQAIIDNVVRIKPATAKGQYVKKIAIAAAMSPSVLVQV